MTCMKDGLIDLKSFRKDIVKQELRGIPGCEYLINCSKRHENEQLMNDVFGKQKYINTKNEE